MSWLKQTKTTVPVVGLRRMRGYSDTKLDGKSAGQVKPLRRHFGP
jgi:hypothetical protein